MAPQCYISGVEDVRLGFRRHDAIEMAMQIVPIWVGWDLFFFELYLLP